MAESRRLRAGLAMAAAGAVLLASAVVYLHPLPLGGRQGQPWSTTAPVPGPVTARFQDFQVASARVAWVCLVALPSGAGLLFATSDGGQTWRPLTVPASGTADYIYGIQLIDQTHSMLQFQHSLYMTSDGGRRWRRLSLPPGQSFGPGAHFLSPSVGWYFDLAAYPGQTQQPTAMWWTSNAGASWTELWRVDSQHAASGGVPLNGSKYVMGFRDASSGWLAVSEGGSSSLLVTTDGGHSWSPANLPLSDPAAFYGLRLLPSGTAVLLAKTSSAWLALPSRDGGRMWEEARPVPIPTPALGQAENRPSFIDHDHWAVADRSRLHVTSDAGRNWHDVAAVLPRGVMTLHDLWLTAAGEGWATAGGAFDVPLVLHTTDGGAHWALSRVPYITAAAG